MFEIIICVSPLQQVVEKIFLIFQSFSSANKNNNNIEELNVWNNNSYNSLTTIYCVNTADKTLTH